MSDVVHVIRATVDPNSAPNREGAHWVNTLTKQTWLSVGTSTVGDWILMGDSPTVKITASDTTANYLNSKLTAGTGISLTVLNPGANESISISAPGSTTDEKAKVSAADTTPGYLNTEITVSNGVNSTNPLEKSITSPGADEKLNLQFDQTKISMTSSQISDLTETTQDIIGATLIDTASVDFTYNDAGNQISAVVLPAGVNHDALLNFVANKHIDHSAVSLIAGTGISATGLGDITASRTINLANTAVTPGSYGSSTQIGSFTVDAQGRLTAASNITISSASLSDFTEAAQDAVGGILTDTTSIDFTYNDAGNTISAVVLPGGVNHDALLNWVANKHIDHSAVSISSGTGLTGGGDITASRTLAIAATGVTGASYGSATQIPTFTVSAQGQLTAAINVPIAITSASVTDFAEAVDDRVAALVIAGSGISVTYNDPANTLTIASTITQYTDEQAQDAIAAALTNTSNITFSYNDPLNQISSDLTNTAVTAGSYGSATQVGTFTVDSKGRLTAAGNVTISTTSTSISDFTEAVQDVMGGALVDSSSVDFQYNDAGNTQTAVVLPAGVDHNALANWVANKHIDHSLVSILAGTGLSGGGDITASRTLNLANTAVTPGTYGSTSQVATFAVDAQGRLTSAANAAITPASIGAQPLDGDLTAIAALTGVGIPVRTATDTWAMRVIAAGTGISVTNGDGLSGNPTVILANVGTAGTYGSATQVPVITTNAQGQVTSVVNTAISTTSSSITDFVEAAQDAIGAALVDTTSVDFTYNDAGNTISAVVLPAGVNHDALQNWVANKHIDHSLVSISAGAGLTGGGDITASRTISMPNVGTAGTYGSATQVPVITTDAQGRVTGVTNTTVSATVAITTGQVGFGSAGGTLTSNPQLFWDETNKRLGIGTNAPVAQIHLADETGQNAIFEQANNTLEESAYFEYRKSRGTLASKIAVVADDKLGGWGGFGWDGTMYDFAGQMLFYAEAPFTGSSSPGYFIVSTTPVGSTSPVERLRINSSGLGIWNSAIRLGTTTDTTNGNIRYTGTEFQAREGGVWRPFVNTPSTLTSTSAVTTTSATYATVGSMTTTPAAGTYLVHFTCAAALSVAATNADFSLFVDGVEQTQCKRSLSSSSATAISSSVAISTTVTVNGSQVVDIRFRENASGTLTANARELILIPVSR